MTAPLTTLLPTPTPQQPAASALLRAALEMLGVRPGQAVAAVVTGTNAQGVTQLRIGVETLAVRLSVPIPAGTPVRVTVQPAPGGQMQLSVQPLPVPVAAAAAPVGTPMASQAMPQPVPVASVVVPTAPATAPAGAAPASVAPTATTVAAPQTVLTQPPAAQAAKPPSGASQSTFQAPAPAAMTPAGSPTPSPQAPPAPNVSAAMAPSPGSAPAAPYAGPPSVAPAPMLAVAATVGATAPSIGALAAAPPPASGGAAPMVRAAPIAGGGSPNAPSPVVSATTVGQLSASLSGPQAVPAPTAHSPVLSTAAPTAPAQGVSTHPAPPVSMTAPSPSAAAPALRAAPAPHLAAAPRPLPAPAAARTAPAPRPAPAVSLPLTQPAQAAARQDSMAPLLQNLSALPARVVAEVPRPVAEPAKRLLDQRITLDRGAPTASALKQAVLSAGVLASPSPGADTRTALLQLRAGLLAMLGDGEIAPVAPVARRPPPPHKDAQPRAMRAEPPTLPANAEPRDAARTLLGQTDAALSRLKLLQLASQPQETRPGIPILPDLQVEIPMVLGHETAMAQLRIQKDGKGGGKPSERGWRLRFAVSFSQVGEVGAQVSLIDGTTSVALWANEPATADVLEDMLPDLAPALTARGLTVGAIRLRRGAPPDDSAAATGRLVDSRS